MRKRFTYMLLIIIFSLTGCFSPSINKRISKSLGIKIPENIKIEYEDTHGGFHGDGVTLAKVQFKSKDAEKILSQIKNSDNWRDLPLSENIKLVLYGGKKGSVEYVSDLAKRLEMPKIQSGYWIFIDRFGNENKFNDDKLLLDRCSANYTVAIYDIENNILYYCEFDS